MHKPFSGLEKIPFSPQSQERLTLGIRRMQRKEASRKSALSGIASFASLLSLCASFAYLVSIAQASGFSDYLYLAFSDGSVALYSRELMYSLLESLPALALALVCTAVLASFWSLSRLRRNFGRAHFVIA